MKLPSLKKLIKDVEWTTNREIFTIRLKAQRVKNIDVLWKVYKLILFTDYVPSRVRDTFDEGATYLKVSEKYGVAEGTIKRVSYDYAKQLETTWGGGDIISELRNDTISPTKLKNLQVILKDSLLNSNKTGQHIENNFTVDIFNESYNRTNFHELDDTSIQKAIEQISKFSLSYQEDVLGTLDKLQVSYIKMLLTRSETSLTDKDKQYKQRLLDTSLLQERDI